jgi:hypothetical protein
MFSPQDDLRFLPYFNAVVVQRAFSQRRPALPWNAFGASFQLKIEKANAADFVVSVKAKSGARRRRYLMHERCKSDVIRCGGIVVQPYRVS